MQTYNSFDSEVRVSICGVKVCLSLISLISFSKALYVVGWLL